MVWLCSVGGHCFRHGEPGHAGRSRRFRCNFPRFALSLIEIEDGMSVRVAVIVCRADVFDAIRSGAQIPAQHPHTTGLSFAVAEMQTLIEVAPIRNAARRVLSLTVLAMPNCAPVQ